MRQDCFAVALVALCACSVLGLAEPPAESLKAGAGQQDDAKAVVQRLLDKGGLELSSAPTSVTERFYFRFTFAVDDEKSGERFPYEMTVVRDGAKTAMIGRPDVRDDEDDAPPFFFVNDKLVGFVDVDRPGGLILFDDPNGPVFRLDARDGAYKVDMGFGSRKDTKPRILFDAQSILSGALEHARTAHYDKEIGLVGLVTKSSVFAVAMPLAGEDQALFGLRALGFSSLDHRGGREPMKSTVTIGTAPQPPREYLSTTRAMVEGLGLPTRELTKKKDTGRTPFPNAGFRNQQVRRAAEKLGTLFPRRKLADLPPDPTDDSRAPVPATRALATDVPNIPWPPGLSDVVFFLQVWCDSNGFGTNFVIDPAGLRDAGVEPDAPVTIDADGEDTMEGVLTQALTQAGRRTRKAELSFATTGRFVLISTAARAKGFAADLRADAGRGTTRADRAALARPMTRVLRFPALEDVMDMAAKASGLAVEPDWEQLATAGLKPDDTVTIQLRAVTVAQFLRVALQDAAPTEPVAFVATDGRIRVSSRTALSAEIRELDAATKARRAKAKATTQPVPAKRSRRASSPAAPPG